MVPVSKVVRGAVTIPARIRREVGLEEGAIVGFEVHQGRLIVQRVTIVPVDALPAQPLAASPHIAGGDGSEPNEG